MTTITIAPNNAEEPTTEFRAVGHNRESVGLTPGAALDALTGQLDPDELGSLVVVFEPRPDEFFSAAQLGRLTALKQLHRASLDGGRAMSAEESAEMEQLFDAEFEASAKRAEAIAHGLRL